MCRISIVVAQANPEDWKCSQATLEFRTPANTSLASVTVNGEKTETTKNKRGFIELSRKLENGDVVAVDLDYQLKTHFQDGEENSKWIAFTYGPLALAQKITEIPGEEPFLNYSYEAHITLGEFGLLWRRLRAVQILLQENGTTG